MKIMLAAAITAGIVFAQQPNSPAASFIINGVSGPPYPILMTVQSDALASGLLQGQAGMPFIMAEQLSGQLQPGAALVYGGSVDLALLPMPNVFADGTQPGSPFHTDASGITSVFGAKPQPAVGTHLAYQALVGDPMSPFGFTLTAAIGLTVVQTWTTTYLNLGDESEYHLVTPGFQIPFYGHDYSSFYIGSNGYMTLGATVGSDYTASPPELSLGPPRICGLWCDLDCPPQAVALTLNTASAPNGPGFVRIDYVNVPDWGISVIHSFSLQIYDNGLVQIIHRQNQQGSSYDQIVGISAGGNLDTTTPQANLSAISQGASHLGAVNERIYEWFGIVSQNGYYTNGFDDPYDLFGRVLTFLPAGTGALPGSTNRYLLY